MTIPAISAAAAMAERMRAERNGASAASDGVERS